MDADRFDALARSLDTPGSRRRTLGGLLAGAIGLLGSQRGDDAAAHNLKKKCQKKSGEAKKTCLKKARKHAAAHASETPPLSPPLLPPPCISCGSICCPQGQLCADPATESCATEQCPVRKCCECRFQNANQSFACRLIASEGDCDTECKKLDVTATAVTVTTNAGSATVCRADNACDTVQCAS